ncbi:DUF4350 domain-containing protein [Natrialbaceae archaeon AArc-T1-2]|uniref:DUF4350 domain-containing protein n=1 Tax=Natrialbaceae archaeon AArc-T1-2 TaxID=3053904 RepID=UPI00255A94D8|nr:DUF4350 domain-containing protein [Natrialbaceae archaeon AArc-T1-2]WIV68861.1 DUF4350 domain-containing protein [Natrialbaceae archaeon AArc-T1-2]
MNPIEWFRDGRDPDWPRVVLAGLAIALIVAIAVAGATSTAAFGAYNPAWDGTSEFRDSVATDPNAEHEIVRDATRYDDLERNGTVAFVVAPEEQYGDDAEHVRGFVDDGGTLVVLENVGQSGNALLADVGADARTDGRLIRDEQYNDRGPAMPIATDVANHSITEDVDQLTLNHGTVVHPDGATVLVSTSEFAYLVDDPDSDLEESDAELDSYPVATIEDVGDGRVVTVGDPSIAINIMLDEPNNQALLEGLYQDEERVVFDLSHADDVPPLTGALLVVRGSAVGQVLLGLLGVAAVATASRPRWLRAGLARVRAFGPPMDRGRSQDEPTATLSDAERAAYIRRRHPDWDDERVQRVIAALNRNGSKRDDE